MRVRTIWMPSGLDGDAFLAEYRRRTRRLTGMTGEMVKLAEAMRLLARVIAGELTPAFQNLSRILTETDEFFDERWEAGCV